MNVNWVHSAASRSLVGTDPYRTEQININKPDRLSWKSILFSTDQWWGNSGERNIVTVWTIRAKRFMDEWKNRRACVVWWDLSMSTHCYWSADEFLGLYIALGLESKKNWKKSMSSQWPYARYQLVRLLLLIWTAPCYNSFEFTHWGVIFLRWRNCILSHVCATCQS